jgi:hypothetical protein
MTNTAAQKVVFVDVRGSNWRMHVFVAMGTPQAVLLLNALSFYTSSESRKKPRDVQTRRDMLNKNIFEC